MKLGDEIVIHIPENYIPPDDFSKYLSQHLNGKIVKIVASIAPGYWKCQVDDEIYQMIIQRFVELPESWMQRQSTNCSCSSWDLFNFGCRCHP